MENTQASPILCSLPGIDSADYVQGHPDKYRSVETSTTLHLLYPSGDQERFILASPKDPHEHDPREDLVATIKVVASEYASVFSQSFIEDLERPNIKTNDSRLADIVATFNLKIEELKSKGEFDGEPLPCSLQMSSHIWRQAYERTIEDPKVLNQYKGFSKEVYGETNSILINDVITKQLTLKPKDVFIDLGSGIGNVVFQVAAQTLCTCHGIELKDNPSRLAQLIQKEAEARCRYFHKGVGQILQRQGDFLGDEHTSKILSIANVVFVNNFAFEAETNQSLMLHFLNLKDGAKIVCFKEFSPVSTRITAYNQNDLGAILQTRKVNFWGNDGVSWTSSNIDFFIHVVDRARLKEFMKNEPLEEPLRRVRRADSRSQSPQAPKKTKFE